MAFIDSMNNCLSANIHAFTLPKKKALSGGPSSPHGTDGGSLHSGKLPPATGIVAKVRAAIDRHAPFGNEDETGFHPGLPDGKEK
jgi:hypothetical protein